VLAGVVARAQAIVAAARGSWAEAKNGFLEAAETFRRHGMVWEEAYTLETWGHALQGGPDRGAANAKLDEARAMLGRPDASRTADGRRSEGRDETVASSRAMFRREGEYWTIASGGRVMRLRDAKGLHYIAHLLAHPGREIFVGALVDLRVTHGRQPASTARGNAAGDLGDAGSILDAKAREQYRGRLRELEGELAEAVQCNDLGRSARLRAEVDAVREQLVSAVGLGGRARRAASHTERMRLMVTKAIKAALVKIRAGDATLGRHLATSIKTGSCCLYDPGPSPTVAWDL
jgi:non-specific serine/threonine protein kinase